MDDIFSGHAPMRTHYPPRVKRVSIEPAKWLPVGFVVIFMVFIYVVYSLYHLVPLFAANRAQATFQTAAFNVVTLMMVWCYVRSILTPPGEVPDSEEWICHHNGDRQKQAPAPSVERKIAGTLRTCKWCSKYKPDRAHHCRVCMSCVLRMDHHCPWIYNCVGFHNHKYFFLLLLYGNLDILFMLFTMSPSLITAFVVETPFHTMFLLLFEFTFLTILGMLLLAFFTFHCWLAWNAMTTIEFCEKQSKQSGFNSSAYNRGWLGNVRQVLGPNIATWFVPVQPPEGDGLCFVDTAEVWSTPWRRSFTAKGADDAGPSARSFYPSSSARSGGLSMSSDADHFTDAESFRDSDSYVTLAPPDAP